MDSETQFTIFECPTQEIAAYIDGEMDGVREFELETHLAGCEICSRELNQQKHFLCGLNSSLKHEGGLDLPANFTKLIVANAESTVSGLRRPRERYNAIFICVGLLLFVLFALGAEAGRVFEGVSTIFDQVGAVSGFFGRLVSSVFLGIAIILRSIASQLRVDVGMVIAFAAILAALLMYVSRRVLRIHRA